MSDGSKTLSLSQIYSDDFSLPSKETQDRVIEMIETVMPKVDYLIRLRENLDSILQKHLSIAYKKYQKRNIRIKDCIDYSGGTAGLTEEFIYSTLLIPGEKYKVRSSSTSDDTLIGYVPQCKIGDSDIKINARSETLLVARNGNAGQAEYLVNERYAINDHAYILFVKEDCPYRIHLKWLSIQYREEFLSYASSSDNGTWNMTGFFNHVVIDIPDYDEQLNIVRLYEKAEILKSKINRITDKLSKLLNKEIC